MLVSEAGVVWTSGCGIEGQLGHAPAAQQIATSFRKVEGELFGRAVVSAAAGLAQTVCVTRCGRVYAWGGTVAGSRSEGEGVGLAQCRSPRMLESGVGWSHLAEELRAREAAAAAAAWRPRKGGMDQVDEHAEDDGEMHVGAAVGVAGGVAVDAAAVGTRWRSISSTGTSWGYGLASAESAGMLSLMQEPAPAVMHQPAPTRGPTPAPALSSSSVIPLAVVTSHRARVLAQGPARRGRGEATRAGDSAALWRSQWHSQWRDSVAGVAVPGSTVPGSTVPDTETGAVRDSVRPVADSMPPPQSPSGARASPVPRLKLVGWRGAPGLVSGPSAPPRAGLVAGLRLRGGRDDWVRARADLPGRGAGGARSQSLGAGRDAARPQCRPGISVGHAAEGASERRGVRHVRAHGPLNAGASARNPLARLGGSLGSGGFAGGACGAGVGVGAGRQTPDLWGRSGTRSCLNA